MIAFFITVFVLSFGLGWLACTVYTEPRLQDLRSRIRELQARGEKMSESLRTDAAAIAKLATARVSAGDAVMDSIRLIAAEESKKAVQVTTPAPLLIIDESPTVSAKVWEEDQRLVNQSPASVVSILDMLPKPDFTVAPVDALLALPPPVQEKMIDLINDKTVMPDVTLAPSAAVRGTVLESLIENGVPPPTPATSRRVPLIRRNSGGAS